MDPTTPQSSPNIRSTIDSSETLIREVISEIEDSKFCRPESYEELSTLSIRFVEFVERQSEKVHSELVLVSNILEDCLRTIFIVNEDATLEGFATELETQLGQLRLLSEGIKELPGACNEEFSELFTGWNDRISVILTSREKYLEMKMEEYAGFTDPALTTEILAKISLYNASYYIIRTNLKTFQESCVKVLSVLSMVAGKWERKIEERINEEEIQEGMVMTAGREIRNRRRNRRSKPSELYY